MWGICHINFVFTHKTMSKKKKKNRIRFVHGSTSPQNMQFCFAPVVRSLRVARLLYFSVTSEARHMPSHSSVDRYQCYERICCFQTWILNTLWRQNVKSHAVSLYEDATLYICRCESLHITKTKMAELLFLPTEMQRPKYIFPFPIVPAGFSYMLVPIYQTEHITT